MKQAIYIPGLGDHASHGQITVLRLWRAWGVRVHYHPVSWADGEAFAPKLQRLLAAIDKLTKTSVQVALIGTSAGASAVINAYLERQSKVSGVIYICGKIQNPQTVSEQTYNHNPAFKDSLELLQKNLLRMTVNDKHKILSIRPLWDNKVPVADTKIAGVAEKLIPTLGHTPSIAYALTLSSYAISKFIKKSAKV